MPLNSHATRTRISSEQQLGWAAETVAHEMGHTMGLGHSTDRGSVMWPSVHDMPAAPDATDVASAARLLAEAGL